MANRVTSFDLASDLGVLQIVRDPSGQEHVYSSTISVSVAAARPAAITEGADLIDSASAWVAIGVRENVAYRTARLTIPTVDSGGETFTVTIDGNAVDYVDAGSQGLNALVTAIAAAINADGTVGGIVEATAVEAAKDAPSLFSLNDSVRIRGIGESDFSVDFATDGSSVVLATADAISASADVFVYRKAAPNTAANQRWRKVPGTLAIDSDGYAETWNVGPVARMYIRLFGLALLGTDGSGVVARVPDIDIAPGILES